MSDSSITNDKVYRHEEIIRFVDIFAGCGGLSLGLIQAGWTGLFAIERDKNAFETLSHNFLQNNSQVKFIWPESIPQKNFEIEDFIDNYKSVVSEMASNIDLLVGGPPCQGFSSAGKRDPQDPRNKMVAAYFKMVDLIKPKLIVIENVRGIQLDFFEKGVDSKAINYADWIIEELSAEYLVFSDVLNAIDFGIPQRRERFFIIAIRRDLISGDVANPFDLIKKSLPEFLKVKGLSKGYTSSRDAISDLEVKTNGKCMSRDSVGFEEIEYIKPISKYQMLMNEGMETAPTDTRLARHKPHIAERFQEIIDICIAEKRLNTSLSTEMRVKFGIKKRAIRVLNPQEPAPTITSMPDDLIHYDEPRTLTVRENARLQSFPDWFEFKGKYTSGGDRRHKEVPRFTQVANAVPPLMAEALGEVLAKYLSNHLI